jgi:hypothetical protein
VRAQFPRGRIERFERRARADNGVYQGYQAALTAAFTLLAAEIDWFPGRG